MPLPKPRENESESEFIDRCMGDETMREEYPDNEQRLAVCYAQWRRREGGKSMQIEHKSLQLQLKEEPEGSFVARIATLNVIDKDGDVTLPGAFPDGKAVLVSAYQHSTWQGRLPVGKAIIREIGDEVLAEGQFNLKTQTGREHYEAVKFAGGLQEWSYGFQVVESEDGEQNGQRVRFLKKVMPVEISPVILGAGVGTATQAIKAVETKGAKPPHRTPKAPEDAEWDAAAVLREVEGREKLWLIHAWRDDKADPDAKSSYKLPHHYPDGRVVWRGVAAAMAALIGARGGVQIPEADKRGVYRHLETHYRQFDKEPPEFRAADDGLTYADQAETVLAAVYDLADRTKSLADLRRKEGRVLSTANRERIKHLLEALTAVANDLKDLLDATEPDREKAQRLYLEYLKIKTELLEVKS